MLDRSDLLWRDDDPTPATTPARDDHAKDDRARPVTPAPRPTSRRGMVKTGRRHPPATTSRGLSKEPTGPREHPEWTPQQRANHEAHHARLARLREERAPEWARQDERDRQDEAARTHAREARANDRRPTRADRARQERAGHRTTPTRRHAPPAIGGNTRRARTTPRRANGRAAAGPNARAMRWPTWGCIEPCPTKTCPINILTATPTPPGAASIT